MEFDPQHGWVERGTRGVHGGAVVQDLAHEVRCLEGFATWARLSEVDDVLLPSCQERHDHHIWLIGRMGVTADKRFHAFHVLHLKLAMLTPYVTMMHATAAHREAQQARRHFIRIAAILPPPVEQINITVNLEAEHADL